MTRNPHFDYLNGIFSRLHRFKSYQEKLFLGMSLVTFNLRNTEERLYRSFGDFDTIQVDSYFPSIVFSEITFITSWYIQLRWT